MQQCIQRVGSAGFVTVHEGRNKRRLAGRATLKMLYACNAAVATLPGSQIGEGIFRQGCGQRNRLRGQCVGQGAEADVLLPPFLTFCPTTHAGPAGRRFCVRGTEYRWGKQPGCMVSQYAAGWGRLQSPLWGCALALPVGAGAGGACPGCGGGHSLLGGQDSQSGTGATFSSSPVVAFVMCAAWQRPAPDLSCAP